MIGEMLKGMARMSFGLGIVFFIVGILESSMVIAVLGGVMLGFGGIIGWID